CRVESLTIVAPSRAIARPAARRDRRTVPPRPPAATVPRAATMTSGRLTGRSVDRPGALRLACAGRGRAQAAHEALLALVRMVDEDPFDTVELQGGEQVVVHDAHHAPGTVDGEQRLDAVAGYLRRIKLIHHDDGVADVQRRSIEKV